MARLGEVPWPPDPVTTDRLILRPPATGDRHNIVELACSPEVYRYLGGPRTRLQAELDTPHDLGDEPGLFTVVALDGMFVGTVSFNRRDRERPGHLNSYGEEVEVNYLFAPTMLGRGYAFEAVTAALSWIGSVLPGEPVVVCTQTANHRSVHLAEKLGFLKIQRFTEFDAEQWFGVRTTP
ncbi:MAG: GNAT family N-acetyltransferase [Nocardioides sp.]